MLADAFTSALGAIIGALFLLGSLYIYIALIRQISARRSTIDPAVSGPPAKSFGWPEAILAGALVLLLILNLVAALSRSRGAMQLSSRDLVANVAFTFFIVFFVAAFLKIRGLDLNSLGGFSKISFVRAAATGAILLLAAYPLIALADAIAQRLFGSGSSKQGIVDLFNGSQTLRERIIIIVLAVAIAPAAEEFIFRFFLYGVLKRYLGPAFGIVSNALLFAVVHAHWPSFAPLFVLGTCFTLAYEWSGSILVSMTMHSLFNSVTLTILAFPEVFQQ